MRAMQDSQAPAAVLTARGVEAGYDEHLVLRSADCELRAGSLSAVIGANGSGKTTLLKALCAILPLRGGEVRLGGTRIGELSRREIARRIAFVPQFADVGFEVTVEDTVALGRYPWVGSVAPFRSEDWRAVDRAIDLLDLEGLRKRALGELSGGERQRALLARSWAQDAKIFLLDEPVASLDLRFQHEIYTHLRRLAHDEGRAVLVADHHINLVAAFCDRVYMLREGGIVAAGSATDTLTRDSIQDVFGIGMHLVTPPRSRPQFVWAEGDPGKPRT